MAVVKIFRIPDGRPGENRHGRHPSGALSSTACGAEPDFGFPPALQLMSLFDFLRPKWKHPDPALRERAVRELNDQAALATVVFEDPVDAIRLAAVHRLTDEDALARIARGKTALAVVAMGRLADPGAIKQVALSAELREVREMAVDRIDDNVTLHRIATSDIDAGVRSKARLKRLGPDQTRDYLRSELSKLQLAQRTAEEMAGFCGTLDDVCASLLGDERFRINGGIDYPEPRIATIRELGVAAASVATGTAEATGRVPGGAVSADCAKFLAFKRMPVAGREDAAPQNTFYEIDVWRTNQNTFHVRAAEKRLKLVQNPAEWSRVSSETHETTTHAPNRAT